MAATPAQRAANRANALKSTGPKSVEGKEAARRNALKHGLTGAGVVLPGEDEGEVTIREAAFREQLVDEGDALGGALVRQMAIASLRVERAFRMETALAAARMRKAPEIFDDERQVLAQEMMRDLAIDPVTIRRRLIAAPEGVDALVVRLRALREQTVSTRNITWDEPEGKELDQILGNHPGQAPLSRAALLTRGIAFDHWLGLDEAEFAEMDFTTRLNWAVGEVGKIIDTEIQFLLRYRAGLDTTRRDRDRAEASERALLDLGKDGIALRRYAGAAERSMLKMLQELRLARSEAQEKAVAAALKPTPGDRRMKSYCPDKLLGATGSVLRHREDRPVRSARGRSTDPVAHEPTPAPPQIIEVVVRPQVEERLASFCTEPSERSSSHPHRVMESLGDDPGVSFAPVTIGRAPGRGVEGRS